ncbi:MetQ/NlpA family ABC transporter substrate-binding protein [Pseudomonas aeruginosa]|nr:MetQ/NlpA family ABC transporter substrate-binding protein [Pseudomonas aeruginosa]
MKKLLAAFSAVAALGLTAAQAAESLTVAATPVPHAEILNVVKPLLAKEGVDLKIKEFTDYVQPNVQVSEKRLDANFFQHQPYLDEFNKAKGTDLVAVTGVHIEPLGAYSSKYKKLDELPSGATVVIPNDATNGGRALLLLDKAGVIKLKDNKSITATPKDIVDNPKNIKIRELEAATLPRVLTQVDMALINNYYWYTLKKEKGELNSRLHYFGNQDPGALVTVSGAAVLKSSKHPKEAQQFVAFMLSEEGQKAILSQSAEYPMRKGMQADPALKPFAELDPPKLTPADLGEASEALSLERDVGLN